MNAILSGSTQITRRCEILNADLTPWRPSVALLAGSVTVDASRDERRACDVTVGFRGTGTHDLRLGLGDLWYDKLIRLYRGVSTPDLNWEVVLGTFMPDKIDEQNFPGTFHITGRDLTKKMLLSKLTEPVTFVQGTPIDLIVMGVTVEAGIFNVTLPWDSDNPAPVLTADVTFAANATRWSVIKDILLGFNYEVFFDRFGYLIIRNFQDPAETPSSWVFETGPINGNLVSWTKSTSDARLFNHVVVVGGSDAQLPIYAEAVVTDPGSPVFPGNATQPGIGDRVADPISSITANTLALAQALADSQLKFTALEEFNLSMSAIVIPWLEGGNVVSFIDPDPTASDDPTSFYLHDFTIPLDLAPMTANADRVVIVS